MNYPTFNTSNTPYNTSDTPYKLWTTSTSTSTLNNSDFYKQLVKINNSMMNKSVISISDKGITIGDSILPHIKEIKILNPNKVVGFTFDNGKKIKTICDNNDTFNLEYACFLAYAKLLYSKDYTFEGVLYKAKEISYKKEFVQLVKEGLRKYKKAEKEKEKTERLKQEQKERNINKQKKKELYAAKRKEKQLKETIDIVKVIKEEMNK